MEVGLLESLCFVTKNSIKVNCFKTISLRILHMVLSSSVKRAFVRNVDFIAKYDPWFLQIYNATERLELSTL